MSLKKTRKDYWSHNYTSQDVLLDELSYYAIGTFSMAHKTVRLRPPLRLLVRANDLHRVRYLDCWQRIKLTDYIYINIYIAGWWSPTILYNRGYIVTAQ